MAAIVEIETQMAHVEKSLFIIVFNLKISSNFGRAYLQADCTTLRVRIAWEKKHFQMIHIRQKRRNFKRGLSVYVAKEGAVAAESSRKFLRLDHNPKSFFGSDSCWCMEIATMDAALGALPLLPGLSQANGMH